MTIHITSLLQWKQRVVMMLTFFVTGSNDKMKLASWRLLSVSVERYHLWFDVLFIFARVNIFQKYWREKKKSLFICPIDIFTVPSPYQMSCQLWLLWRKFPRYVENILFLWIKCHTIYATIATGAIEDMGICQLQLLISAEEICHQRNQGSFWVWAQPMRDAVTL